jgi:NADPH-dependent glutamate synthase beta subunit-like oxidoreductase
MRQYNVEIPDHEYWKRQIRCQYNCPVNTDSRGYVTAIAAGNYEQAYRIARGPNPFASICGRVCGAPCEAGCRRGKIDEAISIRALKRFVTEKYGVEAKNPLSTVDCSFARRDPNNPKAGTKVAVIGGGVGGFTCAHDLALLGYKVTVFESAPFAGGMLVAGVPVYRLPRSVVQQEIKAILSLGVELKTNTTVGKDVTINQLRNEGFKAFCIAAGLQNSRKMKIEGDDMEGVMHGIDMLKVVNVGKHLDIGNKVVVVGGGNVAFDVARSAIRPRGTEHQHVPVEDFYEATDVARSAFREGAKEVHMVFLESMDEVPADDVEVEEGMEEGIVLHPSRGPLKVLGKNGKVTGLATRIVKSVFDENRRFNPVYDDKPGEIIEADTVIFAIGQVADFTFLEGTTDIKTTPRGLVEIDFATKRTSAPDVFACGDVADGPGLFINAIKAGQVAATSIDEYLRGDKGYSKKEKGYFGIPPTEHEMVDDYVQLKRKHPPVIGASERATSTEVVELRYPEQMAIEQGQRCLKCHINTIFDGSLCIMCGGCVDVCPTSCLSLLPLSQIKLTPELENLFRLRYGVNIKELEKTEGVEAVNQLGSVMIKDEDRCIRCGFCAKRCPTNAVKMEHFSNQIILNAKKG